MLSCLSHSPRELAAQPGRTLSLLSSRAEMRGLDAERERAEPRSLAASRPSVTALSVLWLPVFLRPRRQEEGDSSLGSSSLLKRLAIYRGRKEKERAACLCALESREAHRLWANALPSPIDTMLPLRLPLSLRQKEPQTLRTPALGLL